MAARKATELEVLVKTTGVEKLRGLTSSLKRLKDTTTITSTATSKLSAWIKKNSTEAQKSINGTKALANSYRQLAANVDFASKEFKEATSEAARLEAQLRKMQATANKGMGKKFRGAASTFGAMGAAGIFGGPEGFIGAGLGAALTMSPAGAIAGGVIGSQVGMARKGLGEIATYTASLGRQRKALQLVIGDSDKYAEAQKFLAKTSEDLAIPQDVITRQFTALTASVVGAGKSVADAQDVFLSITSGIRGTGGSIEDMNSALRATAQVFSKGKVSAEELRQQLGERLPGAFTLFAASMDMTPAMLDKALEQGKVTLDDFMGFSKHLFDNYGENAKILATAPEAAGDRLAVEMAKLKLNFGGVLTNIGAMFQDNTTKFLKFLNANSKGIKILTVRLLNFADKSARIYALLVTSFINYHKQQIEGVIKFLKPLKAIYKVQLDLIMVTIKALNRLRILTGKAAVEHSDLAKEIKAIMDAPDRFNIDNVFTTGTDFEDLVNKINKLKNETKDLKDKTKDLGKTGLEVFKNMKEGVKEYLNSIKDVGKQIENAVVGAFQNMEDALVKFTMTGKLNFNDFARQLIEDINRIIIRQKVMLPLLKGIDHLFNLGLKFDAQGSAYNQQGVISEFAKGGIVAQPTYFRYGAAGNLGVMGEAGAEAILPLKRSRSGNLGVESSGGGSTNIVVNVDASGSSVEGDSGQANEFGNVLAAAIQAELINQKRAGGLLSNA